MQILVTDSSLLKSRVLRITRTQVCVAAAALSLALLLLSGAAWHYAFTTAARAGSPIVSQLIEIVMREQVAKRERFMRENLDAMAKRLGEMQAKLVKLEAMSERVSSLAGVAAPADEASPPSAPSTRAPGRAPAAATAAGGGKGGPFVPATTEVAPSPLQQLDSALQALDERAALHLDLVTLAESRLFEQRLAALTIPNTRPLDGGSVGSGFGRRSDPFHGRAALHSGLDFPAEPGTPIMAAAGGVVQSSGWHDAYGHLVEIDHGNGLVTRYAHASKLLVKAGDLVRRGQSVALVGSTGRSTGPHLHFEVLLDGVAQNPAKFLAAGDARALRLARLTEPARRR